MWEQYKKTAQGMQVVMLVVTALVFIASHDVVIAGVFLVAMQIAAVVGAMWASRLRKKIEGAAPDSYSTTRLRRR